MRRRERPLSQEGTPAAVAADQLELARDSFFRRSRAGRALGIGEVEAVAEQDRAWAERIERDANPATLAAYYAERDAADLLAVDLSARDACAKLAEAHTAWRARRQRAMPLHVVREP